MGEIRTERLRLRPLKRDDLDAMALVDSDPRAMEFIGGVLTREESARWIEEKIARAEQEGCACFVVLESNRFLGMVALTRNVGNLTSHHQAEIGWWFSPDAWGRGYATEAARAVIADGFERAGLNEIVADASSQNVRSLKMMERLGMVRIDERDGSVFYRIERTRQGGFGKSTK